MREAAVAVPGNLVGRRRDLPSEKKSSYRAKSKIRSLAELTLLEKVHFLVIQFSFFPWWVTLGLEVSLHL